MTMPVAEQLEYLAAFTGGDFASDVAEPLHAETLATFQINLGKVCNQACRHCHVDAGPHRTESMDRETADACLAAIRAVPEIKTVDITGGAPEMNAQFRYLVEESRAAGKHVIDRCNLTILSVPGYEDLAEFLAAYDIEVIASLPHFAASRTDNQRGRGVFDASVAGLKKLNALGYGDRLPLHLVYNPTGTFLSSGQAQLELEFKRELDARYGVRFNNLFCINNLPVSRFLESLVRAGKLDEYMHTLHSAFNPGTIDGLMCRHQVSVGYDGQLYDCDFNQMLEIPAAIGHIKNFDPETFRTRRIKTANHCYGCTAGAGSSCGGEIA
jgi:radical SAM/Cys-rich protein